MKRRILMPLLILAVALFAQAERNNLVIAELNWSGSIAICQIMKHVAESRLSMPAEVKQLTGAAIWQGLEKGDVDVFSELWSTAHAAGMQKFVTEKKVVELTLSYDNAPLGFYIPTWVSEKYGIKSVGDINAHAEIFDFTGDGKGDIWIGGFGWTALEINSIKLREYGLKLEPYVVEQWVFLTQFKEAMRKDKPAIFFYWEPEWLFSVYDLTMIKEPPYDPAKWKHVDKNPKESYIACAYKPDTVYIAYPAALKDRLPKAYQFLKNWYMPIDEVSFLIAEIEDVPGNPKKDPAEVARKWVADHPQIVGDWLKGIK